MDIVTWTIVGNTRDIVTWTIVGNTRECHTPSTLHFLVIFKVGAILQKDYSCRAYLSFHTLPFV